MKRIEYLLELKKQCESEIETAKSRIEHREECIKILDELIEREQHSLPY